MLEKEILGYIEQIEDQKKKEISNAYNNSKKIRESIVKNTDKVKEGCKSLIEETDPQLTEEGVKKITKKGKIYFNSLKAINRLVHLLADKFNDFDVPDPNHQFTSSEFNQFIRTFSRLINDVNQETKQTDSIMGLDFMLKKRSVYVPIGKLASELSTLRELQKNEYQIIKTIEDLRDIITEVNTLDDNIQDTKNELMEAQNRLETLKREEIEIEKQISLYLENILIKSSRQRTIRMRELEIELGKHLNSFKKIFKKYAREIQRGTFSGDFGLVNAALSYEEDPVQRFLTETDENPEITALIEELLKIGETELKLKQKDINNLRQELNQIKSGKMNKMKEEWKTLEAAQISNEKTPEYIEINKKLTDLESQMEELKVKIAENDEDIKLKEKELAQFKESLVERGERANELYTEIFKIKE
ncbi:MAG: hypothetical protein EAX86_07705 [Candidatus Heimdallarchaeota archaeon]|nr:hypothetical protein [Candidatus Heimdallarchaeota archaeon]